MRLFGLEPPDLPVVHAWDVESGRAGRFRPFADPVKFAEDVPAADSVVG
ncbi:MAG: hypothetical protein AB7T48_10385 [Solirubrobacterales bacterium]